MTSQQPQEAPTERELNNYLFQYHYEGGTYSFTIPAFTRKEAEARKQLMANGVLFGDHAHEISGSIPGAGIYVRLLTWWKNFRSNS